MGNKTLKRVTAMAMLVSHQCPRCQKVNQSREDEYNPTMMPQGLSPRLPFEYDCCACGERYEFVLGYYWRPTETQSREANNG